MARKRTRKELLKLYAYSHTALTVFDMIAAICDNSLRGPLSRATQRDIRTIARIAVRQRQMQFQVYDDAEQELRSAPPQGKDP